MHAPPGRRRLQGLAILAVTAWLGGAVTWHSGSRPPNGAYPPLLSRILDESASVRPVEGRLVGDRRYRPHRVRRRGAATAGAEEARLEVPSLVRQLAEAAGTPRGDAVLAVALLVTGDAEQAVELLEASHITGVEPEWRADLSAAYLAREAASGDPLDAARAYEHASRLLKTQPWHAAANFNAALALERLSLPVLASRAWQRIEGREPDRDWRAEAAQRARASTEIVDRRERESPRTQIVAVLTRSEDELAALARKYPQVAREYFEDELLGAWGRAVLQRHVDEEARVRGALAVLARALTGTHGETTWMRLADTLPAPTSAAAAGLARGFVAYAEGRRSYEADDISDAARHLEVAIEHLSHGRSPLLGWALVHTAIVRYRNSDLTLAERLGREVVAHADRQAQHTLKGRAQWFLGFLAFARHDRERARALWQQALDQFARVGEGENLATLHIQMAELADALGDPSVGWRHRQAALSALRPYFAPRRRHAVLMSAARSALQQDLPHLAWQLNDLTMDNARAWNAPAALSQAYFYRARTLAHLGDAGEALRMLGHARAAAALLTVPTLARASEAEFRVVEAEVLTQVDARRARDSASAALAWFRANGVALRDDALYRTRARAHVALHHLEAAEQDLQAGIKGFERRLVTLSDPTTRISAFDAGWDLYRDLARLRLARGDVRGALLEADRGRAQELRRALNGGGPAQPPRPLSDDVALLQYLFLGDRIVVFAVVGSDVHAISVADVAGVERLCWQYSRLMGGQRGVLQHEDVLARLYDALVRPVEKHLRGKRAIVIVADGPLHRVSFATLRDQAGRYLGEQHVIVAAPSLAVFQAQSSVRPIASRQRHVLSVGNPAAGGADRDLPPLPGSEREARAVAALYPSARLLTGAAATRSSILKDMRTAHVLHFGGHAIANEAYPALSRLVAAAEQGEAQSIVAFELEHRMWPSLRLAVLAACRTGAAGTARGEGALGIARALLAARVPSVIATLWDIDDDASTGVFTEVHRAVSRGLDGPAAVQAAQRAMLVSEHPRHRDPAVWGAVVAVGALDSTSGVEAMRTSERTQR